MQVTCLKIFVRQYHCVNVHPSIIIIISITIDRKQACLAYTPLVCDGGRAEIKSVNVTTRRDKELDTSISQLVTSAHIQIAAHTCDTC